MAAQNAAPIWQLDQAPRLSPAATSAAARHWSGRGFLTMAELHRIVARVRDALESNTSPTKHAPAMHSMPMAPDAHRAEMVARFSRELEAVGGRMLGTFSQSEIVDRIAAFAEEIGVKLVAIGEGVTTNLEPVAAALESRKVTVLRSGSVVTPETRAEARERLARADLGIAEADRAIASTGTLAVISGTRRPGSLTLLPPRSLIIVAIENLVADLAAALAAIGAEKLGAHRLTLITGPSRTADIEKRIVIGVHGPKALDVIVLWPRDD